MISFMSGRQLGKIGYLVHESDEALPAEQAGYVAMIHLQRSPSHDQKLSTSNFSSQYLQRSGITQCQKLL